MEMSHKIADYRKDDRQVEINEMSKHMTYKIFHHTELEPPSHYTPAHHSHHSATTLKRCIHLSTFMYAGVYGSTHVLCTSD